VSDNLKRLGLVVFLQLKEIGVGSFFTAFFKKMRLPVSATGGATLPLPPRKLRA